MYSCRRPYMDELKLDDQLEHTYSSYVRMWDVAQKTCQRWWTIGRSGERGSGISVLAARHDADDDLRWSHSCHAISTDIPDFPSLSPPLPIIHCFRQVFRAISRICTELLYVGSSWSSLPLLVHVKGSTLRHLWVRPYSPAVSCMSVSSYFDSFRDGW